jgi:hypothetical protein
MRRLTMLAPALAVVALVTAGCGGGASEQSAESSIEKQIEEETGGDADVDIDGDEVTIETSDGTLEAGTGNLPEGFPEDKIPLVEGEVLVGIKAEGGFQVTVKYDGTPADAFAAASSLLTGAGFEAAEGGPVGDTGMFEGNGYEVMVGAADATGDTAVSYFIAEQ